LGARQAFLEARREEARVNQGVSAYGNNPGTVQQGAYPQYQYGPPPQHPYYTQPQPQTADPQATQQQTQYAQPNYGAAQSQQPIYSSAPLPPVPQDQQQPVGPDSSGPQLPPTY